jgi:hypothetical protein
MSAQDTLDELSDAQAITDGQLRTQAALIIGVMAMLLALASLAGSTAGEEVINSNIQASDMFAWYQAKNIRQTAYLLATQELENFLALNGDALSEATRGQLEQRMAEYQATIERYESEPDPADPLNPLKGEGKRQLQAQATYYQARRDTALAREPNFNYAEALFQIAIVIASVSILKAARPLLLLAVGLGVLALIFMANGFFLFLAKPF